MKNNDFTPSCYFAESYYYGFSVEVSDCGDWCRARDEKADGRPDGRARWQRVKWDNNGDPYLRHHGRRYSFNNMMRV